MTLQPLKQQANEKISKTYHLFGNMWDEYYDTRKEAEKAYKECDDADLRLYRELWGEDEMIEEDYIKGRGDFPW